MEGNITNMRIKTFLFFLLAVALAGWWQTSGWAAIGGVNADWVMVVLMLAIFWGAEEAGFLALLAVGFMALNWQAVIGRELWALAGLTTMVFLEKKYLLTENRLVFLVMVATATMSFYAINSFYFFWNFYF